MTNHLYFGDNLGVLRNSIPSESVDLIYLDPPFNSNANYNILFKSKDGDGSDAQMTAFEDTWHWNHNAEEAFDEVMQSGLSGASELLRSMRNFLGENDMMAYLAMMAVRLIELHRVLKPKGSLYLHCDPTASHYLKLLLDGIFGPGCVLNEIIWKRTTTKTDSKQGAVNWPRIHDVIFYAAKGPARPTFSQPFANYADEYVTSKYRHDDGDGRRYMLDKLTAPGMGSRGHPSYELMGVTRHWVYNKARMEELIAEGRVVQPSPGAVPRFKRYLDEVKGVAIGDVWNDINAINSMAQERLGYPTQKPLALLERIINASSNEGDVVLDPFCGCGTAVHAAQRLGRKWIGIDVTHLAIRLIEKRLNDAFPGIQYKVHGTPQDLASAMDLAERDKHQFELWVLAQVDAIPWNGGRMGADTGIDGLIYFKPDGKRTEKAIVEVKGGGIGPKDIGRLAQVMDREKAPLSVFVTAKPPTRAMQSDAAAVGRFTDEWGRSYPRLQIITIEDLFNGRRPEIPFVDPSSLKKAKREEDTTVRQGNLI